MPIDLPPQLPERVTCSIAAAIKYEVPANIVLAVAEKEAGRPGQWVRNSNGTFDIGPMQFNTTYLRELARHGISTSDVAASGCYPFDLAAWRLRQHIVKDTGDLWTRASNYHSRTPHFNQVYRGDLIKRAAKWADWLSVRFKTHEVKKTEMRPAHQSRGRNNIALVESRQQPENLASVTSAPYVQRKLLIDGQP